jgi:hypothetical protein
MTRPLSTLILSLFALASAMPAQAVDLLVPSYFYPGGRTNYWLKLDSAAPRAHVTAILNPASGPGSSADANYVNAVTQLHAAGGKVIAYVSTRYTARALSDVTADIDRYLAFYPVDGFFIDEMTNDTVTAHVQFYQSVYNYIKGLNAQYTVVGNPGASTQEIYLSLPVADQLVVFEGSASAYASYAPSSWQVSYDKSHFVHMVYNASKTQMTKYMANAGAREAGSLFVTSDRLPNPYDTLPAYWSDEVTAAAAH